MSLFSRLLCMETQRIDVGVFYTTGYIVPVTGTSIYPTNLDFSRIDNLTLCYWVRIECDEH